MPSIAIGEAGQSRAAIIDDDPGIRKATAGGISGSFEVRAGSGF
jgi:hypothetical protein